MKKAIKHYKVTGAIARILLFSLVISFITISGMKTYAAPAIPDGFQQVAASQNLILYCNGKTGAIAVEDRRNGYLWRSVADSTVYDLKNVNDHWLSYMTSMMVINHIDSSGKDSNVQRSFSASDAKVTNIRFTDNGLSAGYLFTTAGIEVTLDIRLEGDSIVVTIPADQIKQTGKRGLSSIELMPFFGAADRTVDGYMFYPDGSGAITRYGNVDQRPKDVKEQVWSIYGPEKVELNDNNTAGKERKHQAMLPVYGIKNGNNAILAASCKGEEDINIRVQPDGLTLQLNRIFFELNYRHFYNINLSNITVNGKSTAKTPVGIRADKEIISSDREMRLFFLQGEKATYSGMANVYRDYLVKNNLLRKVVRDQEDIPLGVDLFMGIKEDRMLFDKFIQMTTFAEAVTISEELKKSGVASMQVTLKGWSKGGYGLYPVNWPPEGKLGGEAGLKGYLDYAQKNRIQLYLQNNFTLASTKNGGFSTRKDVVMQGNNLPVTGKDRELFLLNPFSVLQRILSYYTKSAGYHGAGAAIDQLGASIYHDYNKSNPATRAKTREIWEKVMDTAVKNNGHLAIEGGNLYALRYADKLYNIPVESSGYQITDEAVPFYQMVVHGMIPYTSEPANLTSDLSYHKLKWVEYGCMPYLELTYQKSVNLKDTAYKRLFTSYYLDWTRLGADMHKEFNTRLSSVWSRNMTEHEKIGENLFRVRYDNGTTLYINYNENEMQCDGYRVKARDYLVVEKGGTVK